MEMMSAVRPLETFVPARAAGQRDVLSLALPPMPLLKVAFVGVGARGRMAVTRWCHIPKVEIAAVCDVSKEVAEEVARHVEQLGKPRPKVYWGEMAYLELCQQQGINLVYVCTDWMSHVPIAIHAMEQGRSVAVEVPAALALKDIWKLIDTAEQTRQHCMMLENAVYDRFEMAVCQMVHEGLLGELVHVEGGYAHPIGDRWTPWRMEYSRLNAGDVYPTHSIGPVCRLLDIHRTDCMHYLTAMQTNAFEASYLPFYLYCLALSIIKFHTYKFGIFARVDFFSLFIGIYMHILNISISKYLILRFYCLSLSSVISNAQSV